jgi:hypothetical protein
VLRVVPGLVNTEEVAECHVLLLAYVSPAISAARKTFRVSINALAYAAKYVRKIIVRLVPIKATGGWISLK